MCTTATTAVEHDNTVMCVSFGNGGTILILCIFVFFPRAPWLPSLMTWPIDIRCSGCCARGAPDSSHRTRDDYNSTTVVTAAHCSVRLTWNLVPDMPLSLCFAPPHNRIIMVFVLVNVASVAATSCTTSINAMSASRIKLSQLKTPPPRLDSDLLW